MSIVSSIFDYFSGDRTKSSVDIVCHRFTQVLQEHGVEKSQIPRLLPQVKLTDLQSAEKLLGVLNPELLDQVANMFGVRVSWLEGVDEQIYDYLGSNKEPIRILEHLQTVLTNGTSKWDHPIRVLRFPRFFVCQRAVFMLPVFPDVAC